MEQFSTKEHQDGSEWRAAALSGVLVDILAEQTLSDDREGSCIIVCYFVGIGKKPHLSLASHQAGTGASANSA